MSGCATSALALAPAAGSGPVAEAVAVARLLHGAARHGLDLDVAALLADLRHVLVRRALARLLDQAELFGLASAVGVEAALLFHGEQDAPPAPGLSPERWLRRVPPSPPPDLNEMRAPAVADPAGCARARPLEGLHGLGSRPPFAGRRVWLP